jgi:hypothetical protein
MTNDLPGASNDFPDVTTDLPDVTTDLPDVTTDLPDVTTDLPDVTVTNSSAVKYRLPILLQSCFVGCFPYNPFSLIFDRKLTYLVMSFSYLKLSLHNIVNTYR